jgi:Rrf2 family protein
MTYSLAFSQAIMVAIYVADKVEQGFFDFVPTKQLSQDLNIPRPSAVKILNALSKAGIIETREGAKGGVRLGVPASELSILDILEAIESGRGLFHKNYQFGVVGDKPERARQAVDALLGSAEDAMKEALKGGSIEDFLSVLNQ